MSGIFEEGNMRRILEQYIPDGETLLAGIHAAAKESVVKCVYGKCVRTENRLVPDEKGGVIAINKKKCFITMKNGSYFKLILPKLGGLGGGMPHHTEYRDKIIAWLGGRNA